jgi:hypothetical protein
MSILPQPEHRQTKILWAEWYIGRRWPVFVLGHRKTPIKNCERCDTQREGHVPHDMESCPCLTCHGFYAATLDIQRVKAMLNTRPDGMLAVRTGGVGRLLVIDAEATADERAGDGLTGLDVLDAWEQWTGLESLSATLRQRTGSGGLHLVYRLPMDVEIHSQNRVLPQVDVKANGGYVAVPDGVSDRYWLDDHQLVADAPADLLDWLSTRLDRGWRGGRGSGRGGGGGTGVLSRDEYERALRDGAWAGVREPFLATLSFELHRKGLPPHVVEQTLREHWERCEQPMGNELPWSAVEYKIRRDSVTVRPQERLNSAYRDWIESRTRVRDEGEDVGDESGYVKVGRVTMVRRTR